MHLVDDLVLRVCQGFQVVVHGGPGPCPCPGVRVSLDEDVLRCCASCADDVDGGLVEMKHQGPIHVVVLVVWIKDVRDDFIGKTVLTLTGVEDHPAVRFGLPCNMLPPTLEVRCTRDNRPVADIAFSILMGTE